MSIYPPPPAGWDAEATTPNAPRQTPDDALRAWATSRAYELNLAPNTAWFQAWAPFVYLATPTRAHRELRGKLAGSSEASFFVALLDVEGAAATPPRSTIVSFVMSTRLSHRAALRSRLQKEAVEELRTSFNPRRTPRPAANWRFREKDRFMRRTYGRSVKGALGDAIFEAHYEITTPSREEGIIAFPMSLRQALVQHGFRGIIEVRSGGLMVESFGPPELDPATLERTLGLLGEIYGAITAPSSGPPSSGPGSYPVSGVR